MSSLHSLTIWLRRTFGWVTSPHSWVEILVGFLVVVSAVSLGWFGSALSLATKVVLWGVLLLITAVLLRQGWLKLFGPVLFYDMVRSGRRGRYILLRCLYAGFLLFILFVTFLFNTTGLRYEPPTPQQNAQLAEEFFVGLMATQLLAVLFLTPAYVAGAIADEKNRKTLEFMLATDLRSREIVLSKLGARLGQIAMLVLTGLPILSLLQFLGGIDPNLVLAGFAATGLTMFGLAGISILHSTYYKRPRNAIAVSYLTVVAYLIFSFLFLSLRSWMVTTWTPNPVLDVLVFLMDAFNSGNLLMVLGQLRLAIDTNRLDVELPILLGNYALFQGLVGVGCILWSMYRLRPVALHQASRFRNPRRARGLFGYRRPRIGEMPMLWKELFVEGGLHFNWIGLIILALLVGASFIPAVFILYRFLEYLLNPTGRDDYMDYPPFSTFNNWSVMALEMNIWVRWVGLLVFCLLLLAVAVRASNCISGERDRQTFESLLTTPLSASQILSAKWLGNVLSLRHGMLWLGTVYGLGLVTGGLHPLAFVFLLCAWLVYASCVSIIGCWFSLVCKTSLRATVVTVAVLILLGVGHWLPWLCCTPLFFGPGFGPGVEYLAKFQAGLTPPVAIGFMSFHAREFLDQWWWQFQVEMIAFSLVGLGFWFVVTLLIYTATAARFSKVTNRLAEVTPDFPVVRADTRFP